MLIEGVYLVGFLEIRGHFCKHTLIGNTDVHCESKPVPDLVLDMESRFYGRSVVALDGGIIHETFVHAELLNIRTDRTKKVHQFFTFLMIIMHIRTFHDESGTFAESTDDRLSGLDTVFLSRNRLGENDAVTLFLIAADDGRNGAQVERITVLQAADGTPA